jgi:hypothetical protein
MTLRDLALFLTAVALAALITAALWHAVPVQPEVRVRIAPSDKVIFWGSEPRPWWYAPEREC